MAKVRFSLDEEQFLALCAGRTVRVDGAEFHLKDLGWGVMAHTVHRAANGDHGIPCDQLCAEPKGHPGPCRMK